MGPGRSPRAVVSMNDKNCRSFDESSASIETWPASLRVTPSQDDQKSSQMHGEYLPEDAPNVRVLTGGAEYGSPRVQRIIEVPERGEVPVSGTT